MQCWSYQTYEGDYDPEEKPFCTECGERFNHVAVEGDGGMYSHRCGEWVELWPGKHAPCALPTHTGECIGEVAKPLPPKKNYNKPQELSMRVYTDGGCKEGVGGWGWWSSVGKDSAFGSDYPTTNQRMELTAAREAIDHYLDEPNLIIVSDSRYLVNGMNQRWWARWEKNGWINAKGEPVANQDLWESLAAFAKENPDIKFEWVKGHSGVEGNERADKLATKGMLDYLMSRRRIDELREMLHAHSYAYYVLYKTVITDAEWDAMARRLVELHVQYPHAKAQGYLAEYFQDWDGSTGFDMPWTDYIKEVAEKMVARKEAA